MKLTNAGATCSTCCASATGCEKARCKKAALPQQRQPLFHILWTIWPRPDKDASLSSSACASCRIIMPATFARSVHAAHSLLHMPSRSRNSSPCSTLFASKPSKFRNGGICKTLAVQSSPVKPLPGLSPAIKRPCRYTSVTATPSTFGCAHRLDWRASSAPRQLDSPVYARRCALPDV